MKLTLLYVFLLTSAPLWAQNSTRTVAAGGTVYNYRPVMFATPCPTTSDGFNACQIVSQTGTSPAFGIVQVNTDLPGTAYAAGVSVPIATSGQPACEFDSALQSGTTATALNGYCHYDPSIVNDSQVCSDKSAIGRIQQLRPDLVAALPTSYFGDVNFREPAGRGSEICQSSPGIQAAVLNFGLPACASLTGTTGSIGGSLLALGACASGTATVTGVPVGRPGYVSTSDGSFIGGNYTLQVNVATAGVATVNICAVVAGTPPAKTYNLRFPAS